MSSVALLERNGMFVVAFGCLFFLLEAQVDVYRCK
jgi:hypothetical protein